MCLYSITSEYNAPLELPHPYIDDDWYDMDGCGAAVRPTMDLSNELRGCSFADMTMTAIRLSSGNVCLYCIAAEYNAPLEVPHAYIDDDWYYILEYDVIAWLHHVIFESVSLASVGFSVSAAPLLLVFRH